MSYFSTAKRQKISENKSFTTLPSNIKSTKYNFILEINGNSESNLNVNTPAWIYYDLTSSNKQIDLFGNWKVGISACIISNSLISWQKSTENKTELPYLSFVKLAVKFKGKESKVIGFKYFQNRLYAKDIGISQINTFLSQLWSNLCHFNEQGINIVGEVFSLTLFSFYLDKLTNSVHILSVADNTSKTGKKHDKNF